MDRRLLVALPVALLAVLLGLFFWSSGDELSEEGGESSLPFSHSFGDQPLVSGTELLLSGSNNSDQQQILVMRLDNADSKDYRSRVNQEYSLPPGEFSLSIPLTGLKNSGGKVMKQPYTRLLVFASDKTADIQLTETSMTTPEPLPENTLALDLGHKDSPVFPAFEKLLKGDPRIQGKVRVRFRKSGDALVRDGMGGIKSLVIPWPNGQWKLSLWAEDQGEWEYLPHYLSRKITAENTVFANQKWSISQWIKLVYLAGTKKEADIDGDLWDLTGGRRSGFIQKKIEIHDGMLNINFQGDKAATYLSALVLEPLEGGFANKVQKERKERFVSKWPVSAPEYSSPETLTLTDISGQPRDEKSGSYLVAKDSLLNLTFEVNSPENDNQPIIAVASPRQGLYDTLSFQMRYGHWRYERPYPNATSLVLADTYLRSDMDSMKLSKKRPRRIYMQVNIPATAKTGEYKGSIQLLSKGQIIVQGFKIKVLPVILPKLAIPVGLYLEPAPYYNWFSRLKKKEFSASMCDWSLLASHGFTSMSPSLATPHNDEGRKLFIRQMSYLKRAGFSQPILAYTPFKRLLEHGNAHESLIKLKKMMQGKPFPEIYWSIFDEPIPEKFEEITQSAALLRSPSLQLKPAGHLNNPKQKVITNTADLLIMNHGYGVNEKTIEQLKTSAKVWLYNMPKPRLAAGALLWRLGAEGYIQWHGRMPTADLFDPTDGREGDVAYIYPWQSGSCPKVVDIHSRFLDLHEATLDYRWLHWLESQAVKDEKAQILLQEIRNSIPDEWERAADINATELQEIRRKVIDLTLN